MNILIIYGYSDSNKGDLAITYATYKFLRKKYPQAEIFLHSTFRKNADFNYHNRFMIKEFITIKQGLLPSPYSTSSKSIWYDVLAMLRLIKEVIQLKITMYIPFLGSLFGGEQYRSIQDIKNADLIIVKGGQFIYNDKEDLRGNLFLWRTLQPIKVANKLKKKIIVFGQSFGGFATKKSEKVALKYLNYCDIIMAREKVSLKFLKDNGLEEKSQLIPDLAFYLKKEEFTFNKNNIEKLPSNSFGVTIVNWSFSESKNPKEAKSRYLESIYESIIYIYKTYELTPVFIPQVTIKHHGKSDNDLVLEIQSKLNKIKIPNLFISKDLSIIEMMSIYKNIDFLIGTRLHSCILAANVNTPIIAIRYQGYKTQGVMEGLEQQNLVLDIHTINTKDLNSKIDFIVNNKDSIKQKIDKKTLEFSKLFDDIKL